MFGEVLDYRRSVAPPLSQWVANINASELGPLSFASSTQDHGRKNCRARSFAHACGLNWERSNLKCASCLFLLSGEKQYMYGIDMGANQSIQPVFCQSSMVDCMKGPNALYLLCVT